MIFVSSDAFAQMKPTCKSNLLLTLQQKNLAWQPSYFVRMATVTVSAKPILAPNFYTTQLGFFCKQEIKMDKVTRISIRFRLGSVEQCDWLEGKTR
ncbi:MAG: hypothetical protein IPP72_07370 [Chitinophagaceae bacterium]|nr:hypothetical protein [Chitinophagaceae bacterium]